MALASLVLSYPLYQNIAILKKEGLTYFFPTRIICHEDLVSYTQRFMGMFDEHIRNNVFVVKAKIEKKHLKKQQIVVHAFPTEKWSDPNAKISEKFSFGFSAYDDVGKFIATTTDFGEDGEEYRFEFSTFKDRCDDLKEGQWVRIIVPRYNFYNNMVDEYRNVNGSTVSCTSLIVRTDDIYYNIPDCCPSPEPAIATKTVSDSILRGLKKNDIR
jgi:hypothetical protein